MIIDNTNRNLLPEGQVDNMRLDDYLPIINAKTRNGFRDRIQIRFVSPNGTDFIQNYNASLLPESHFGQFLRKLFGEDENYDTFELDRLIGIYCKLTIVHRTDVDGKVYANVADVERSSAPPCLILFGDDDDSDEFDESEEELEYEAEDEFSK